MPGPESRRCAPSRRLDSSPACATASSTGSFPVDHSRTRPVVGRGAVAAGHPPSSWRHPAPLRPHVSGRQPPGATRFRHGSAQVPLRSALARAGDRPPCATWLHPVAPYRQRPPCATPRSGCMDTGWLGPLPGPWRHPADTAQPPLVAVGALRLERGRRPDWHGATSRKAIAGRLRRCAAGVALPQAPRYPCSQYPGQPISRPERPRGRAAERPSAIAVDARGRPPAHLARAGVLAGPVPERAHHGHPREVPRRCLQHQEADHKEADPASPIARSPC